VVYKTIYSPFLIYGCESWARTKSLESRLQSNEMRYLRSVVGDTRRDRMRNSTIRIGLNVEPLVARIKCFQLRWFGHVRRIQKGRYPKTGTRSEEWRKAAKGQKTSGMSRQHSIVIKRKKMYLARGRYQGTGPCSLANSLFNLYTERWKRIRLRRRRRRRRRRRHYLCLEFCHKVQF
jgi:hypothetical protein